MKLPLSSISKLALAGLVILGAAGVWLVSNVEKFSIGGPDDEDGIEEEDAEEEDAEEDD